MYNVGILSKNREMLHDCSSALAGTAEVLPVEVDALTGAPTLASSTHLLLVPLPVPVAEGVAFFARCRRARPETPLILMGSNVDVDFVVEFLKCGADDYVSLPLDFLVLRRKVQRALGKKIGSALNIPALEALGATEWAQRGKNLRHSYRVKIESTEPVRVILPLGSGIEIVLTLVDISVPIDRWPGGMLLSLGDDFVNELPFDGWNQEQPSPLSVMLPDGGSPVVVDAYPISTLRHSQGGRFRFNVKYDVRAPADLTRLIRFWSEIQRSRIELSALKAAQPRGPSWHPQEALAPVRSTPAPPVSKVSRISSWMPPPQLPVGGDETTTRPSTAPPKERAVDPERTSRAPEWIPPPPEDGVTTSAKGAPDAQQENEASEKSTSSEIQSSDRKKLQEKRRRKRGKKRGK